MCDYCGCRSDGPIARWGEEHAVILSGAGEVIRALDANDVPSARTHLAALALLLGPHAEMEEATLFAELRTEGELVEEVERLEGEHAGMRLAIGGLAELDDGQWATTVRQLMSNLKTHIEVEEYDLFPASWQMLSTHGWGHVVDRMKQIDVDRANA